jgi:H+/Cl- antiporter ClcA
MRYSSILSATPTFESLPAALIIGCFSGLFSSGFIVCNTYINMFRNEFFSGSVMKVIEVTLISIVTTTFFYWLPYFSGALCYE